MGLRDTIKNLANTTITASIGDLKSTATFRSITTGDYEPASGIVTRVVTTYDCQCLTTNVRQNDVDDLSIVATGVKVLVPTLQLEGVNVDALDDEVSVDGVLHKIHSVKRDPSGALYAFMCTAKQGAQLNGN